MRMLLGPVLAGALAAAVFWLTQDKSSGQCEADGPDGTCKAPAPVNCSAGIVLALAKQPDLALRHFWLDKTSESIPFLELSSAGCKLQYTVGCDAGGTVFVQKAPKQACEETSKLIFEGPLTGKWEICFDALAFPEKASLRVLQPLVDLTFDTPTAESLTVQGCVTIWPADFLPHLQAVRGEIQEQQAALLARKEEVGGCPTWTSSSDYVDRADDFRAGGNRLLAFVLKRYQRYLVSQAQALSTTGPPAEESALSFSLIGSMIALNDFKNTEAYLAFTKANCGIAVPLGIGVMAPARFSEAADAAGDPHQPRAYVGPWASGVSDICFHPTLPLFLSSGSPEHTQTRKLWDAAGLANMHERDFADFSSWGDTWARYFRDSVGLKEPTEEEVASLISPILFERIFKKRPTEKEAELFAEYATYGKLCIKSAMIAKSPWLPSKIRQIRSALVQFAMDSPTGKALDTMLKQSQYADLRRLYESTGEPLLEVAVRNLADASLFAGLVGTTDMTWKCTKNLFRHHEHVRAFRRNPTDYLWELMRVQPAVQGFTSVLSGKRTFRMYGQDVELPAGTRVGQNSV
ncbi:unnamed protein product [Polarella glacialis]|uniref:Uncharacterized protein n=1 Tax=Polarella glacialis TaxID=89957 RepID=A0A813DAS6_POLGL|nr:unnamed protein product [Polarella glacialis]